jgi:F0F1-type ATP synthase membrane subunit a
MSILSTVAASGIFALEIISNAMQPSKAMKIPSTIRKPFSETGLETVFFTQKHLFSTMPLPLFFLVLVEQVVRPFSLALRLYGNMYGEENVTENLYEIFPIAVPLVMNVLSLLFCMIQALVFTMLFSIYVSEAFEE